jgi:putative heme-binding domain-containing protein
MRSLLHFVCCLIALALPERVAAQSSASANSNPFDTLQGIQDGRALFQIHCSYCHGGNGEGGRGADLTSGKYRRGGSDADLFGTVRNGIPGTEMPAVRASDDEVWKMVAFVRKIGSMGLDEKAPGDRAAGKAVFEGKGRCLVCHSIGSEGGSLGPELSDVGRRRNLTYLEESLLRPEADVAIRYRGIQLITKSGQKVSGVRLNEDDVSIQLRDNQNNLRSFLKENIREIRRDQPSLMPAYGSILNKREIEDVVAYLSSLRGLE